MLRKNNSYQCFYYRRYNKSLIINSNTACWAGLNSIGTVYWGQGSNKKILNMTSFIFIDNFLAKHTPKNYKKIINIVNKITSCKIIKIKNKEYIRFKLIKNKSYNENLILLNFIRMIWYKPCNLYYNNFFSALDIYKDTEDPLSFLLSKVKENTNNENEYGYGGHSIVHKNLIIRTVDDLMTFDLSKGTIYFLTNK